MGWEVGERRRVMGGGDRYGRWLVSSIGGVACEE